MIRYVTDKYNRSVGNTYRMVLSAVLECSSNPGLTVALLFKNDLHAIHAMRMAMSVTQPLNQFAVNHMNRIAFDNGSQICFVTPNVSVERWRGFKEFDWAQDTETVLTGEQRAAYESLVRRV